MFEEILLINRAVTDKDSAGFEKTEDAPAACSVMAERKSTARSEFYAAQAAGIKADVVFVIWLAEYSGENIVRAADGDYSVVRTYVTGRDHLEMTCTGLS